MKGLFLPAYYTEKTFINIFHKACLISLTNVTQENAAIEPPFLWILWRHSHAEHGNEKVSRFRVRIPD